MRTIHPSQELDQSQPKAAAADLSVSSVVDCAATLKDEFRARFNWDTFAAGYIALIEDRLKALPTHKVGILETFALDSAAIANLERGFADRLIEAYLGWSKEKNVVVLWDIDGTMGENPTAGYSRPELIQALNMTWGFRPCMPELLQFLSEKFPEIKNGILSNRGNEALQRQVADPEALGPIAHLIDAAHIYSTEGKADQKPVLFAKIQASGVNVKSVDNDRFGKSPAHLDITDFSTIDSVCVAR